MRLCGLGAIASVKVRGVLVRTDTGTAVRRCSGGWGLAERLLCVGGIACVCVCVSGCVSGCAVVIPAAALCACCVRLCALLIAGG